MVREEVLRSPSVVPAVPGVYAWYLKRALATVPTEGCLTDERGCHTVGANIGPAVAEGPGGRRAVEVDRSSYRYDPRPDCNGELRKALVTLASQKACYGYRRLWAVLSRRAVTM